MKNLIRATAFAAGVFALAAGSSALAEQAPQIHVRGSVVSFSGTALKVKSREGKLVDVEIAKGAMVTSVANASLAAVKAGDYLGIASMANAKGDHALEVLIFPPALKGAGEGSFSWDLKPHSSMTNASVTSLVKGVNGHTVSLAYGNGGQKTINVPDSAPVVTLAPASNADLKPGAIVFVAAEKTSDGHLAAHQVVVGKDGVTPPM
jgi:hypothetical protein